MFQICFFPSQKSCIESSTVMRFRCFSCIWGIVVSVFFQAAGESAMIFWNIYVCREKCVLKNSHKRIVLRWIEVVEVAQKLLNPMVWVPRCKKNCKPLSEPLLFKSTLLLHTDLFSLSQLFFFIKTLLFKPTLFVHTDIFSLSQLFLFIQTSSL